MVKKTDDKDLLEIIDNKIKENVKKYGKPYCPCVLPTYYTAENSDDYVCMCKEFREQTTGVCHCGKWIKY